MEPLGRLCQGTRYFDALAETSLYAGQGGRERSRKPETGRGGRIKIVPREVPMEVGY